MNGEDQETRNPKPYWGELLEQKMSTRLQGVEKEIHSLKESAVTHKGLIAIAAGVVLTIFITVLTITMTAAGKSEERSQRTEAVATDKVSKLEVKMDKKFEQMDQKIEKTNEKNEAWNSALQRDLTESRNETREIYKFLSSGKRSLKMEMPAQPTPVPKEK